MEEPDSVPAMDWQPQGVSRKKEKRRLAKHFRNNNPAATATIINDTNCCQSIISTYAEIPAAQQAFAARRFAV